MPKHSQTPQIGALCIREIGNLIGNKGTILFDVANEPKDGLIRFDIWFCGVRLTVKDNMAYAPSIISALKFELAQLENKKINPDNFWFNHGPTTDNFFSTISLSGDLAFISVEYEDRIYKLNIPVVDLQEFYELAIYVVSSKNT